MTILYIGAAVGATLAVLRLLGAKLHERELERDRQDARANARVVEFKARR